MKLFPKVVVAAISRRAGRCCCRRNSHQRPSGVRLRKHRVFLHHGSGVVTRYGHLASIDPKIIPGVRVEIGQRIGIEGSTGTSTGLHLHSRWRSWHSGQSGPVHGRSPRRMRRRRSVDAADKLPSASYDCGSRAVEQRTPPSAQRCLPL
jgi:murein DD-endopeptidase MepM/ murein hydrolase activator NlpD